MKFKYSKQGFNGNRKLLIEKQIQSVYFLLINLYLYIYVYYKRKQSLTIKDENHLHKNAHTVVWAVFQGLKRKGHM